MPFYRLSGKVIDSSGAAVAGTAIKLVQSVSNWDGTVYKYSFRSLMWCRTNRAAMYWHWQLTAICGLFYSHPKAGLIWGR